MDPVHPLVHAAERGGRPLPRRSPRPEPSDDHAPHLAQLRGRWRRHHAQQGRQGEGPRETFQLLWQEEIKHNIKTRKLQQTQVKKKKKRQQLQLPYFYLQ